MNRALAAGVGALLAIAAAPAAAQPSPQTINAGALGYPGAPQHGACRDAAGNLYAVTISDAGGVYAVQVLASPDGGQTWSILVAQMNDATSGLNGPTNYANLAAMAIDDMGQLHVEWIRAWYPSYYQTYYRNYHIPTATPGPIIDLNTTFGISTGSRSDACHVAVGPDQTVWLCGPSASSWRGQLYRSTAPWNANNAFTAAGVIAENTYSSQGPRLAIDSAGNVHAVYYNNLPPGVFMHRVFDPVLGVWAPQTMIGDAAGTNDTLGDVCADQLGFVHALVIQDSGGTIAPKLRYRRWDAVNGWAPAIPVADFTTTQMAGNDPRIADIACNELTGDVFAVYRDMAGGGDLVHARLAYGDTAFVPMGSVAPPSTAVNEYWAPFIAGADYPFSANTGGTLDIFWRQNAAAPFAHTHVRRAGFPLATRQIVGTGCIGSSGVPAALATPYPAIGAGLGFAFHLTGGPPFATAYLFAAYQPAAQPLNLGSGCQVYIDLPSALFLIQLGISPAGPLPLDLSGSASLPLPLGYAPANVGLSLAVQGLILDPPAPLGLVLTNAVDLVIGY